MTQAMMPTYHYTARDERGTAVTGTLAAQDPEALADQLKRMGYLVTKSREVAEGPTVEGLFAGLRRVGYADLMHVNVQLSTMIQVGVPLVTALTVLAQQTENPRLREAIGDAARNVEGGASFSEALSRHPGIFSTLFVSMVHAGEVSGKLDEILRRLAAFSKHQLELREQLKTALTYPVLLLVVGIGAAGFLLVSIIPKFMQIFLEANVPLPLPTLLLYQLSVWLRRYGLWLAVGIIAGLTALRWYRLTPAGRRTLDATLLRLPVLGDLARKAAISRLTRTLQTLLSSGVPVLESLAIAGETCGNAVIAGVCETAQASVRQGGTISETLKISREFPPMVIQMMIVGEASGTLDRMLGEIAGHYDELIQHGIKRLTTLVEPAFLILMGGMVAFIMASILLPLFRMVNVIR